MIEAENGLGEQFGQERLEEALTSGRAMIPTLFESVRKFANRNVGDDLSILAMEFPISNSNDKVVQQNSFYLSKTPAQSKMRFPASVLKSVTVMSEVRQFLTGVMTGPHLDLVCSVLSELFANAIEHGLLHLDSKIKEEPDGFFTFYQLREEKLKELSEELWVTLFIDYKPEQKQLVLELEHNGVGFDYNKLKQSIDKSLTHGRGIVLASELCDSLDYSKQGKCVTAVYSLDAKHHFPSSA